ncbi:glycosyltransferase [Lichenicola sp.]|uniref:glycosyltransferase n=1 Tax=Lichenicola sp. TaxID=2804529 RepID=UPI003AFFC75D
MTMPARLHFCWIGTSLPWAYVFAVMSAAEKSGLADIVLHHTDTLEPGEQLAALTGTPGVRLQRIDPEDCLTRAGGMLGLGGELVSLYHRLNAPVMRSDVLRAAILYLHGGIYLDLDTVTVASLLPLIQERQFVGSEFIVWPHAVRTSRSPIVWARHLTLDLARKLCRRWPGGWKGFRWIETAYARNVNNAVMGAEANSELFADYLRAMVALPAERQVRRYGLGPHLLARVVDAAPDRAVIVHRPSVFYPLAPEISEHWFRRVRRVPLGLVLSPDTRVVHWYASVRTKALVATITPDYIRANRKRQLYSALVWSCVGRLPEAA